jgi:hypothetical protein
MFIISIKDNKLLFIHFLHIFIWILDYLILTNSQIIIKILWKLEYMLMWNVNITKPITHSHICIWVLHYLSYFLFCHLEWGWSAGEEMTIFGPASFSIQWHYLLNWKYILTWDATFCHISSVLVFFSIRYSSKLKS